MLEAAVVVHGRTRLQFVIKHASEMKNISLLKKVLENSSAFLHSELCHTALQIAVKEVHFREERDFINNRIWKLVTTMITQSMKFTILFNWKSSRRTLQVRCNITLRSQSPKRLLRTPSYEVIVLQRLYSDVVTANYALQHLSKKSESRKRKIN